ncbi:MAG: ComEA family DNA-binding protein [Aeromonadaceae bacterium]
MQLKKTLFTLLLAAQPFVGNMALAAEESTAGATPAPTQVEQVRLNINTASAEQLMELKGIGKKKAEAIISWRTEHGKFASIEQLAEVNGISDKFVTEHKAELSIN